MSYVRKGVGLKTSQLRTCFSRDLVFLQISTQNLSPLNIVNIYNAPPGSTGSGEAVQSILATPQRLWQSALLAGDFNLHHPNWNPTCRTISAQADILVSWLDKFNFSFTSEVGQATHNRGNQIDLAFITGFYTAITTIAEHMDVTSDHSPLLSTISWENRTQETSQRLRPETVDSGKFTTALKTTLIQMQTLTDFSTVKDLDLMAVQLTNAISSSYSDSARRKLGRHTGHPWWDTDCKDAAAENRSARTRESARSLRRAVRRAKTKYCTDKIDSVQEMNDVFKMT
jgi:hypothetical protein